MPVITTSSPRGCSAARSPFRFPVFIPMSVFLSLFARAIWCDVSRQRPEPPVASRLRAGLAFSKYRLPSKTKKGGTGCAPFLRFAVPGLRLPPKAHLAQRRCYDNVLGRVASRHFPFVAALQQLLALRVSYGPDLSQKILATVAVEYQLG